MESTYKGTFNPQAFLDSAGIARKIVEYRQAEVIFTQGDPCASRIPNSLAGPRIEATLCGA